MRSPEDLHLSAPRLLADDERQLIDRMLEQTFDGRDQLQAQLVDARVAGHGPPDTRTIVFASPSSTRPRVETGERVPVDAVMIDEDGVNIEILLHVVDGYARELEIYRVDGTPIQRASLDGPLKLVNWRPAAGNDEPS
jgi:hypothetical protein